MRGQRLFVRPAENTDGASVAAFLKANGEDQALSACGLLGKLVGELVVSVGFDIVDDGLRIDHIVVARELRRKRIGRMMLDEVARIAAKMDRDRLIVEEPRAAREFFRRVGFVEEGKRVVRRIDALQ